MDPNRLSYLFQQYFDKTATESEIDELLVYIDNSASEEEIAFHLERLYVQHLENINDAKAYPPKFFSDEKSGRIIRAILVDEQKSKRSGLDLTRRIRSWGKYAAVFAVIGIAASFYLTSQYTNGNKSPIAMDIDIVAGDDKAFLTLSDGKRIVLNDVAEGAIVDVDGVKIVKTSDGELVYEVLPTSKSAPEAGSNTISTPRGGKYQVKLPDGTKVWLNAASSLRYPVHFLGNERRVELEGEAYFEVAKDLKKPFRVISEKQEVTVLGTHFNVNSYKDEPAVLTTVLEGSVRVTPRSGNRKITGSAEVLKPNQQSVLSNVNAPVKLREVNGLFSVAWKSGKFQFQNTPIAEVTRQFSRWYDIDFDLEGSMPDIRLWGEVNRKVNAAEALEILSFFGLKYKLIEQGSTRKIIVTRK